MSGVARLPLTALFPPVPPGRFGSGGLVVPGGVFQRLWGDRLILAGGPAALLLQIAHPLIGAGVVEHSDYARRPGHRLEGTLQLVLGIAFGDTVQARAVVADAARRHVPVHGELSTGRFPAGTRYDATDPTLALWVYATLVDVALRVHERYRVPLDTSEREEYWQQSKPFARLFGLPDADIPASWDDFRAYWTATVDQLAVTPPVSSIAHTILWPKLLPPAPGVGYLVRAVTADLLPAPARDAYALPLTRFRRAQVHVAAAATHLLWPHAPRAIREFPHVRAAQERIQEAGLGTSS